MRFRNTACLATLLLSFPLVASDAYCAQEDVIDNPTSGNTKEYSSGEYSKIVMGYAINSADATLTELKANNNTATLNSGVQMTLKSGAARHSMRLQAQLLQSLSRQITIRLPLRVAALLRDRIRLIFTLAMQALILKKMQ